MAQLLPEMVQLLVRVAEGREITTSKPWNYGWSQPGYRRSSEAAMVHDAARSVCLLPHAIELFEKAGCELLKAQQVRERYENNEFWSVLADLVGTLPLATSSTELSKAIEKRLGVLLDPPEALVVLPLANVAPLDINLHIGSLLVGRYDKSFQNDLLTKLGHRGPAYVPGRPWWSITPADPTGPTGGVPTVLAYVSMNQLNRAIDDAEAALEDLTSVALVAQEDLDAMSLFSLRGDAYQPGVRGLVVDRANLSDGATKLPELKRELCAAILVDGVLGPRLTHHAFGEKPFPLETLLKSPSKRSMAQAVLFGSTAVHRRLKVAARWHAKAYWALDIEDAVLALGICFDSMLTEKGPSPGRVISERYALLDQDPSRRRERYREFQKEYYPARSSVAHGTRGRSVDFRFVRRMAKDSRWVFNRIFELTERRKVITEDDYDRMYESLKWGDTSFGG